MFFHAMMSASSIGLGSTPPPGRHRASAEPPRRARPGRQVSSQPARPRSARGPAAPAEPGVIATSHHRLLVSQGRAAGPRRHPRPAAARAAGRRPAGTSLRRAARDVRLRTKIGSGSGAAFDAPSARPLARHEGRTSSVTSTPASRAGAVRRRSSQGRTSSVHSRRAPHGPRRVLEDRGVARRRHRVGGEAADGHVIRIEGSSRSGRT